MVQREMAQRIVAPPGSRTYGRLSVMVAQHAEARILFHVRPGLVSSRADGDLVGASPDAARGAAGAGARRRAVRGGGQAGVRDPAQDAARALGAAFGEAAVAAAFAATGIAGTERAEQLSVADFARLADALADADGERLGDTAAMPELPEVETIVRGLAPRLRGRRIESVWWSGLPLHLAPQSTCAGCARSRSGARSPASAGAASSSCSRVDGAARRGVRHPPRHDRAAAREPAAAARAPHTHVAFGLEGGDELRFVDARRFGWVEPGRPFAASAGAGARSAPIR